MPKADRILANLPPTFRLRGDPSALRALADAYGGELQTAENALVAVMRARWVDFADAGDPAVLDLARIGDLYGLSPRPDESVEEFREHLKRFVRTQLESTVTVEGIVRLTAATLGLHVEEPLDTWWERSEELVVTELPRGVDAASRVLGFPAVLEAGADARAGVLTGLVDLRDGVDLRERSTLRVSLDDGGLVAVDLATAAADPAAATPDEIVDALAAGLGRADVARIEDGRLVLVSPTTGPDSVVAVGDGPDDVADLVLGLRPRTYAGEAATRASITGTADLSAALDLRTQRYLRVRVDEEEVEVDCAAGAADRAAVDVAGVTAAINAASGATVASDDGRVLTLTSPTTGAAGSVVVLEPAAQAATALLLADAPRAAAGRDARPARLVSDRTIGLGVDLSQASALRLQVDSEAPVTIDVAGLDPAATQPAEIVAAVNEGLGAQAASHDGDRLTLVSPTSGTGGALVVGEVPGDAALDLLGLRPRSARGEARRTASVTGTADLPERVDLSSRYLLSVRVDGAPAREVNLRTHAADPAAVTVGEIEQALDAVLGADVATHDGSHLILVSQTPGAAGLIEVAPLSTTVRRRFVTRARVTDDAATTLLGFASRSATGTAAASARLVGTRDLSGGVDLTVADRVRLVVGDRVPVEVACAGPRARATTIDEVVAALGEVPGLEVTSDGHRVTLHDPATGETSRIRLEAPREADARDVVLGRPPVLVRGAAATGVSLVGTVDLSGGVELAADAALRLAVDGGPATDVVLGDGVATATVSLSRIAAVINTVLFAAGASAAVAAHDGSHLVLTSPSVGGTSALVVEPPSAGTDATADVLGITHRSYAGSGATTARVVGTVDLTGGADLRVAHLLRLAVDGGEPVTVDLTGAVPAGSRDAVDAATITAAVRSATTADAATTPVPGGLGMVISSPSAGPSSRVEILVATSPDAAPALFGTTDVEVRGMDAAPAVVEGEIDLLAGVDLGDRSVLRLSVDGGPPVEVDCAGVAPQTTLLGEVVAALDRVLPGVAQASPEQRLRLVSTTTDEHSRVDVLALRHLEVVEYPPTTATADGAVAHGRVLTLTSSGSADVRARVEIDATHGVAGPRLSDPAAGWSVRITAAFGAGARLVLLPLSDGGVQVDVTERGELRTLPADQVHVDPAPVTSGPGSPGGPSTRHGRTAALTVRRGRNRWSWTECDAARFDSAVFDTDRFAGGPCTEQAVFDVSHFAAPPGPGAPVPAVFADSGTVEPTGHVHVVWDAHTAGAFEVNLPADLDARFGQPFDVARFGSEGPERFDGVVTDPDTDADALGNRLASSSLVRTASVPTVPIGWRLVALPFRTPVHLTLGRDELGGGVGAEPGAPPAPPDADSLDGVARLYLSAPGLEPGFLLVRAAERGAWGNDVSVSVRLVGPEIYDVEVHYPGARFENARATVLGPSAPTLAQDLLMPSPVGVGTAKAAGIRATVTRDGVTVVPTHQDGPGPLEEGTS